MKMQKAEDRDGKSLNLRMKSSRIFKSKAVGSARPRDGSVTTSAHIHCPAHSLYCGREQKEIRQAGLVRRIVKMAPVRPTADERDYDF
jgi:hypothetical protein